MFLFPSQVMKDSQLYLVVGTLISIDIITMLVWQIMDPFYRQTKELEAYVSPISIT
jgi:gamma-aminobutyric acid type B receptor